MAERTGIAWTHHTFNPWWGCVRVSPGCQHCYAETFSARYGHNVWGPAKTTPRRTFGQKHWDEPIIWNNGAKNNGPTGRRRRVFCGSMCDVFEDHPTANEERFRLWRLIRTTPWLDWQLLTKRPENIARMLPDDWGQGYPNVWLGTSVEDQERADERIPELLRVPARIRFLSCEPLLGPVDLSGWAERIDVANSPFEDDPLAACLMQSAIDEGRGDGPRLIERLHWVIVGGESGAGRRPMELGWLEAIVADCDLAGIAVFVKQDNAFKPDQRGRIPDELWIREFPDNGTSLSDSAAPNEASE